MKAGICASGVRTNGAPATKARRDTATTIAANFFSRLVAISVDRNAWRGSASLTASANVCLQRNEPPNGDRINHIRNDWSIELLISGMKRMPGLLLFIRYLSSPRLPHTGPGKWRGSRGGSL